jgi:DNA-binding PadR family transcriptional regulator
MKNVMSSLEHIILLALAVGDLSSSKLLDQINSDNRAAYSFTEPGYRIALNRLVKEGKVTKDESFIDQPVYRLSPLGRRLLKFEQGRLERAAQLGRERL